MIGDRRELGVNVQRTHKSEDSNIITSGHDMHATGVIIKLMGLERTSKLLLNPEVVNMLFPGLQIREWCLSQSREIM